MVKCLKGRAGGWGAWPDGGGVTSQGSTIPWLEKRRRLPTLPHNGLSGPVSRTIIALAPSKDGMVLRLGGLSIHFFG